MKKIIPAAEYHRIDALSASTIKTLLQKSAAHARMQQINPHDDPTPQQERGTIRHALTLGEDDIIQLIDAPDFRTKAAQQARDDARQAGRIPVIADKAAELYAIAATARLQIESALSIHLDTDGQAETSLFWNEGALKCKARPDWLNNDNSLIVDLKFTELTQSAWIKSLSSNGYDVQSEWYRRAVRMDLEQECRFIFAVCETLPPYPVYFVELTGAYRAIADVKIERALQIWGACIESNIFPCYSQEIIELDPPAWEMATAEETAEVTHGFDREAFLFGRVRT
jgi:hypothetical protein